MRSRMRARLREEMQIEFTIENGNLHILDGVRVERSARAALRGTSERSGHVVKGSEKPVCPVVNDLRLKSPSEAMCSPERSTLSSERTALARARSSR